MGNGYINRRGDLVCRVVDIEGNDRAGAFTKRDKLRLCAYYLFVVNLGIHCRYLAGSRIIAGCSISGENTADYGNAGNKRNYKHQNSSPKSNYDSVFHKSTP